MIKNFAYFRGIEMMETTQNSATTQAYPLYDTHGNMVATLSKNTAGTSWSLGNERGYDLWGSVRSGAVTGGPKGRYVANLGHVQDDESGLIYMRARYYEPESGRFVSEDRAMYGNNWYIYAISNATNLVDHTGNSPIAPYVIYGMTLAAGLGTGYALAREIFAQSIKYMEGDTVKDKLEGMLNNGLWNFIVGIGASGAASGVFALNFGTSTVPALAGGPLTLTFGIGFAVGLFFGMMQCMLELLIAHWVWEQPEQ
jgi:RHS repeat-associated protein